jgi:hypothetical protein
MRTRRGRQLHGLDSSSRINSHLALLDDQILYLRSEIKL